VEQNIVSSSGLKSEPTEIRMKQAANRVFLAATYCSETLANFQWTTRNLFPEDRTLNNHHLENLKSYILFFSLKKFSGEFHCFIAKVSYDLS
jgi:hypothetical protein